MSEDRSGLSLLQQQLENAVTAAQFAGYPRGGEPFARDWLQAPCVPLAFARAVQCDFSQPPQVRTDVKSTGELLEQFAALLEQPEAGLKAIRRLSGSGLGQEAAGPQWQLLRAMLQTLLAGQAIVRGGLTAGRLNPQVIHHLTAALEGYQQVWPLPGSLVSGEANPHGVFTGLPTSRQALAAWAGATGNAAEIRVPAWLAVQRLLGFVLGEAEAEPDWQSHTHLLLVGTDSRGVQEGLARPLRVSVREEGQPGCYLDPVALGLTVLDPDFLASLSVAWHCLQLELRQAGADCRLTPTSAIRLSPELALPARMNRLAQLTGESAGGAFAGALHAAAWRLSLDRRAASSVVIRFAPYADPDRLGWEDVLLFPVAAETVPHKLLAFRNDPNLRRLALHADQEGFRPDEPGERSLTPVQTWHELVACLTGKAQAEEVLRRYAAEKWEEWHTLRRRVDRHALLYYVPPQLALQAPGETAPAALTDEREEDRLAFLLQHRRVRVRENTGVGKSVLTRRIQAFLCSPEGQQRLSGGQPGLTVLFREDDGLHWPDGDFRAAIEQEIARHCAAADTSPADALDWVLEEQQLTIILDAIDQVEDRRIETVLMRLHEFLQSLPSAQTCRVILTGRPLVMTAHRALLASLGEWAELSIERFNEQQVYRYMRGPEEEELAALFGADWPRQLQIIQAGQPHDAAPGVALLRLVERSNGSRGDQLTRLRDGLGEAVLENGGLCRLLENPFHCYLLRNLATQPGSREPGGPALRGLTSRAELYLRAGRASLMQGLEKLNRTPVEGIEITALRLERLLAAVALEMMLREPASHAVAGEAVLRGVREGALARLGSEAAELFAADWQLLRDVSCAFAHCSAVQFDTVGAMAWDDPRVMQFYCGLHLANNRQPGWVQPDGHCGDGTQQPGIPFSRTLRHRAAHREWATAFRFAMELPAREREEAVLLASLSTLFEPPTDPQCPRPCAVMWEAWQLLSGPAAPGGGARIRRQYRRQFELILSGQAGQDRRDIARELLHSFVRCPRQTWWQRFAGRFRPRRRAAETFDSLRGTDTEVLREAGLLQGLSAGRDRSESPAHLVRLKPYWLMAAPVSLEQFGLFEPYLRDDQDALAEERQNRAGHDPQAPVLHVNWYQAAMFSLWLGEGCRLPADAEWEAACWGGRTAAEKHLLLRGQAKINHNEVPGNEAHSVRDYRPNRWGLYHMLGNVQEWVADWYQDRWYQNLFQMFGHQAVPAERSAPEQPALERARMRVLRGGDHTSPPEDCRCAARMPARPETSNRPFGFRVAGSRNPRDLLKRLPGPSHAPRSAATE